MKTDPEEDHPQGIKKVWISLCLKKQLVTSTGNIVTSKYRP